MDLLEKISSMGSILSSNVANMTTEETEKYIRKSSNWEVVSPATLAVINFRYNPIHQDFTEKELDNLNQEISERIVSSKEALLVTTILQKQVVLRMCLINPRTTFEDVKSTLIKCNEMAKEILKK